MGECYQISYHNNPNLLQGLLYFNIFTVDTWAESKTPERNLARQVSRMKGQSMQNFDSMHVSSMISSPSAFGIINN